MKTKINYRIATILMTFVSVFWVTGVEAQPRYVPNSNASPNAYKNRGNGWMNSQKNKNQNNVYYYRDTNPYMYSHPQYGTVYREFRSNLVRLRYNNGYVYFHGGNYYRYRNNVGYVRIATPRNLVFVDLPVRAERVRMGGQVYFRYGDIVFERYQRGYRLASNVRLYVNINF